LVQWMPDGTSIQTHVQEAAAKTAMVLSPPGWTLAPAPPSESFALSPDGKHRATVSPDRQALLLQDAGGGNPREIWRAPAKDTLDEFLWRPNSQQIAVLISKNNSILQVIDTVSGKTKTLIAPEKKLGINSMVWAGRNRMIVAVWELLGVNSYNSNLWEVRLNSDGALASGGLRKLTAWTDFPIRSGSLTTDGKRLVFVRSSRQRDVYVADLDAARSRIGIPRRLTLDLGDDYPTAWTRDSQQVILTSDRKGPMSIFHQGLDKPAAEPLVALPGAQILPRVAPDGKSLLFCSIDPVKRLCRLMRTPVAGGTPEFLLEVPRIGDFRCSPAGPCTLTERLDKGFVTFELDLVKGRGREIYRDEDSKSGTPDISPDGKWLATTSGTKVILRSFSTGAVVREISVHGVTNLVTLDYAPDGKGFFSGDSSPVEARQLYVDLSGKTSLLWRQAGSSPIWSVPSPDGRHLALMMWTEDSNVYMVENF